MALRGPSLLAAAARCGAAARLYQRPPLRARRDLYYAEEEEEGGGGSGPRGWRGWVVARRGLLARAGVVLGGATAYYWYHLEETPITGAHLRARA